MRLALEGEFALVASADAEVARRNLWLRALPIAGAFAAGALVVAASSWRLAPPAPEAVQRAEVRFEIATPPVTDQTSLALSPDGANIVFEGSVDGQSRLWVHSLRSLSTRPLTGTESASFPFWSPDSRSIGFFADGKLKRVDLDTESVRTLADAPIGRGGTWRDDGTIIFAPGTNDPLLRVSALGGEPSRVTTLEPGQAGHRFPQLLPDGKHFLYYVTGSPESRGVAIADVGGTATRRLFDADTAAVLTSSGNLVYGRQGRVFARGFDPVERKLRGTAFAVSEQVATDGAIYRIALTTSNVGSIAYRVASGGNRRFSWFDRSGRKIRSVGEARDGGLSPAMSPDGRYVAFSRTVNGNQDIWLLDLESGATTRFTFDPGLDFVPLWSPDGSRIVFSSNRSGVFDLYEKAATGAGATKPLLATPENKFAVDWSADGKFLLYVSNAPDTGYDLWTLSLGSEQAHPKPFVRTPFEERDGQFSPDGRWIAYQSNESGRLEVYVQPFPGPGGRWQVSTEGGAQVRWRGDGKELYYLALDGRLMAVPVGVISGPAIEASPPVSLFTPRLGRGVQTSNRQQYIVSADGQEFLMNALVDDATRAPMRVILNWSEAQ